MVRRVSEQRNPGGDELSGRGDRGVEWEETSAGCRADTQTAEQPTEDVLSTVGLGQFKLTLFVKRHITII